ncbi:T9SS type A sorting domain-containing protein [Flavobacterium phycosphaerae]|uniref:T9SS type A sorting domain-containing protein n=1 Tax=Flavobacterium phycosphaerae TaxID=2697515 RepID=UPI001389E412|nr:T9SS type A sorting domain-containing protein [Flavobacterium phycosphaerae]
MKKSIKSTCCKFGLMLFLAMYSIAGKAQAVVGAQFAMGISTASATTNTMDVNLTLTVVGPTAGMRFSAFSTSINFNTAIINGGTISAAYVANTKSELVSSLPANPLILTTAGSIRLTTANMPTPVDMPQGTVVSLGTWRITNTQPWAAGNANLWLQNVLATGKTNSGVNAQPFGGGSTFTYLTTTGNPGPGLVLSHSSAAPYSLTVGQTCATSGSASVTNAACFGGTGSATITLSPAPSVTAVTYTGAGSGSATLTAGGAFTISGLAAGTYSVVVSNEGCGNITVPVTVTEPALQTSSTTAAACGTYTWSAGNGATYTASGDYTYTDNSGACPVERTLHLTITPATSNTTTASACGTYHWGVNDVDYTASGTYTEERDCHTEILVLTITPSSEHTTTISQCGSYTWPNTGLSYSASGTYTGTTTNCVTEKLVLTITPNTTNTTTASACGSYTWSVNDQTYSASGSYSVVSGCHTEVLNLTITTFGITTQPVATNICSTVGSTASLTVAANATASGYTWQYRVPTATNPNPAWVSITANSAAYSGVDTNTLTITKTSALPVKGTQYRVIVNGACGTAESNAVVVTILSTIKAGSITVPSTNVCIGSDLTFTLTNYAATSFQWQSSPFSSGTAPGVFTDIDGATGTTYTLTNAQLNSNRSYRVVAYNACNNTTAISATKTITVNPLSVAGTITVGGGTICEGGSGSLKIAGYVGKIQWEYSEDGVNYFAAPKASAIPVGLPFSTTSTSSTATSYVPTNMTVDLYFRAKVTSGACSSAYTAPVQYIIGTEAIVGTIAGGTTVCPTTGTTLTLSNATGTITWEKSTNYATAAPTWTATTNHSLVYPTGNLTLSTAYRAKVTIGTCSTVYSDLAYVLVVAKPVAKTVVPNTTSPTGKTALTAICVDSDIKVLTIGSGYVGNIQWQTSTSSATTGFTDIAGANQVSYTVTDPVVGVNYFRATFTNSCGVTVNGVAVAVYYKDCTPAKVSTAVPFAVVAYPNPYSDNFHLNLTTSSEERVGVSIYDMTGKLLDKREVGATEASELSIGDRFASGVYNVVVTQGSEVKTLRVVKR